MVIHLELVKCRLPMLSGGNSFICCSLHSPSSHRDPNVDFEVMQVTVKAEAITQHETTEKEIYWLPEACEFPFILGPTEAFEQPPGMFSGS